MSRRTSNGKWQAVWRVPNQEGEWSQKSKVFVKKADADAHEDKMNQQIRGSFYTEPTKETVTQYLRRWLDLTKGFVEASTLWNYEWVVDHYIIPHLGPLKVATLTPAKVEQWVGTMRSTPGISGKMLSENTVARNFTVLKVALSSAEQRGEIPANPCTRIPRNHRPVQRRREVIPLTDKEIAQLLSTILGHSSGTPFLIALTCGLRRGELYGLKWSHIDFEAGTLRVEDNRKQTSKNSWSTGKPKFDGYRTIAVPGWVLDELWQHRIRQNEERLLCPDWQDLGLVFPGKTGDYRNPSNAHHSFNRWLNRSGLGHYRIHDLRHTFGTVMAASNPDIAELARMMGHRNSAFTLRHYVHGMHRQHEMQDKAWGHLAPSQEGEDAAAG